MIQKSLIKNFFVVLVSLGLGLLAGMVTPKIVKKIDTTFVNKIVGKVKTIDGEIPSKKELNKDYFFVFYGADWCKYCKNSKEEILNFYNENKEKYNNFVFILAGSKNDTSNEDLLKYMKNENFPFYYVDYENRDEVGFFEFDEYKNCEKFYIPAFILFDRAGNVLSNSNGLKKEDYSEYRPFEYYKKEMEK